ncbi:hypothetical protein SLA2020_247590 [Shorea laevis]
MGIQKIPHWNSEVGSFRCHFSYGKGMEDNPVSGADSGDDLDDCHSTEISCELGMVEDQICSVPYELYDLPDLREILSLDTWNSCLTDEDRYHLSAYLPDLDQQTFWLTMSELLGGKNMYFGNPVDMFFRRLKAGYYPPKVASLRESLLFLQRRKHLHSLRSYHDKMVQLFMDMRRAWDQCDKCAPVEVRLDMWKARRKLKDVNLLDLNTVPKDGNVSNDEDELLCHFSKRMKGLESVRSNTVFPSPSANGMNFISPNCSTKGVLKVKAAGNRLVCNQKKKRILGDVVEQSQPKGLLKVVPKLPSSYQPLKSAPLIGTQGLQDCKFSSLTPSTYLWKTGGPSESPFLWQNFDGSKAHATSEQPQCNLGQRDDTLVDSRFSYSLDKNINREVKITDLGKCKLFGHDVGIGPNEESESLIDMIGAKRLNIGGKNLWQKFDTRGKGFSERSVGSYPFSTQFHDVQRQTRAMQSKDTSIHSRIPPGLSRISDMGVGMREISLPSPIQLKSSSNIHNEKSEGFKDERVLPLTYKRRKSQVKLNSSGIGNKQMRGSDLRSANPEDSNQHLGESVNDSKVNFMDWEDTSSKKEL